MRVPELLAELTRDDIHVWADGDRLRCNAPASVLTPELRGRLQEGKTEILEFLRSAERLAKAPRSIVPLQPFGGRIPVFAVAGHNGDVFCYHALARHLGNDQPFFGLQPPGLDGQSEPLECIGDLAAYFAAHIREFRPGGPSIIAGFCAGGTVAFELARQLLQQGEEIRFLGLFGCPFPAAYRWLPRFRQRLYAQVKRLLEHSTKPVSLSLPELTSGISEPGNEAVTQSFGEGPSSRDPVLRLRAKVQRATLAAARRYTPSHFAGRVSQFLPCREWVRSGYEPLRWRSVAPLAEEHFGPDGCNTALMLREPHVSAFAKLFTQCYRSLGGTAAHWEDLIS